MAGRQVDPRADNSGMSTLVLGIESSCDETGVALVRTRDGGVPELLAHTLFPYTTLFR